MSWYRDAAFRLVEYARKTGLFDVPADYKLEVVETPPPLRASIDGAAYYPAPPFKNTGVGRFYVTPTHNDPAALKSNNRAALADLVGARGLSRPRLVLQGADAGARRGLAGALAHARRGRRLVVDVGRLDAGGRLGTVRRSADGRTAANGAPVGFYTPEEHLYQLQGKLYRDLRVRIDTGIHTGRLGYDEAVTLFSEVVDFLPGACDAAGRRQSEAKRASCETAERAIFRYSKWPTQAITYRLGKDQIYALRDRGGEAARREVLAEGLPPGVHSRGHDPVRLLPRCAAEGPDAAGLSAVKVSRATAARAAGSCDR